MRYAVFVTLALLAATAAGQPAKRTEMVPMRDGVRLATDVYLPAGDGPWPAVLERTPYDRKQQGGKVKPFLPNGYAVVIQDWRGHQESEGKFSVEDLTGAKGGEDGFDTVEWIARQPWSNGKVGITGGSGPGIAAKQTVLANPPHLIAASTGVAGIHPVDREFLNGGLPETQSDTWLSARGAKIELWPRPRAIVFSPAGLAWPRDRSREKAAGRVALLDHSGWYDSSCTPSFDDFLALRGGNNRLIMAARAHGAFLAGGLKYPPQDLPGSSASAWFDYWLKGKQNGVMDSAPIRYFLMGDTMDPKAPGNVWKQAATWPPPGRPRTFYFTAQGGLAADAPQTAGGKATYAYDPRKPAPTIGGPNLGQNNGPQDQRKLRGRPDVLYFVTEPLTAPLEITGRGSLTLHFSADVPDTSILVKLIDVYPGGYEALQLDQAYMARFRDGFGKPAPLEKDKVYELRIPLLDVGLVFNTGHRIGIIVTGSNSPRFEIHPNSYAPVRGYDDAPVAHVAIHASRSHASALTLPEIAPR
ncbi:MAG TPA: CocE/NonD family hydrolase [Bryobacteraceae bacterium]|nr:CocE/NonD family hydrolase [Bryobacteraceae bacterium]